MKNFLSGTFLSLAFLMGVPALAETADVKLHVPEVKQDPSAKAPVQPAGQPSPAAAQGASTAQPVPPVVTQTAPAQTAPTDAAVAPPTTPAAAQAPEEDPLKDIVIHKRPDDFAGAQQLALQNRDERAAMLQESIACVQQAKTMEDLAQCQNDERKALDKIRLSYCNTMVSFLNGNKNIPKRGKGKGKGNGNTNAIDGEDSQPVKQKASECDKALSAVTGRPIPPREPIPQPDAMQ